MTLISRERNVLLLAACQALFWGALMVGITMSGLVGQILAADKSLATLPAGIMALAAILVTRPASVLMQRLGRRAGFLLGSLAGVAGGLVSAEAIFAGDFFLFCLGSGILGGYQAVGQYYRLAATDFVTPERRGRAVSTVMIGGIVAALAAPSLAIWSKDLFAPVFFAGSFLFVAALSILATGFIAFLSEERPTAQRAVKAGRPMREILRQPSLIVAIANAGIAQGVMVLVMLATPLAMVACNYPVSDAATVIQWHVLGMFLPSFFSGRLIDRFGTSAIALAGAAMLLVSMVIAASGIDFLNFSLALILLGTGWNFMYVAGTTMIAASHRPEERGRVQGTAELAIAIIAAVASFASGGLLHGLGWTAVNLAAAPLVILAAALTLWFARKQVRISAQA